MSKKPSDDLIGALVLKAKQGDSEGENAKRTLKKLCEKHGLDFEDVLSGLEAVAEHMVEFKRGHQDMMAQIVLRYGTTEQYPEVLINRKANVFFFTGTQQRYVEVLNAYDILAPLYEKEKKKMQRLFLHSFVQKHRLYRTYKSPQQIGKEEKKTLDQQIEEMREGMLMSQMTATMEDAEINPRLKGKNE